MRAILMTLVVGVLVAGAFSRSEEEAVKPRPEKSLRQQSDELWVQGNLAKSIELIREALEGEPGNVDHAVHLAARAMVCNHPERVRYAADVLEMTTGKRSLLELTAQDMADQNDHKRFAVNHVYYALSAGQHHVAAAHLATIVPDAEGKRYWLTQEVEHLAISGKMDRFKDRAVALYTEDPLAFWVGSYHLQHQAMTLFSRQERMRIARGIVSLDKNVVGDNCTVYLARLIGEPCTIWFVNTPSQEFADRFKVMLRRDTGRPDNATVQAFVKQIIEGGNAKVVDNTRIAELADACSPDNALLKKLILEDYDGAIRSAFNIMKAQTDDASYTYWANIVAGIIRAKEQHYNGTALEFLQWVNGERRDNPVADIVASRP